MNYKDFSHWEKFCLYTVKDISFTCEYIDYVTFRLTVCPWYIVETFLKFSSEIFGNDRKRSNNLRTAFREFWSRFSLFLDEIYCYSEFFTVSVKMPKIQLFYVTEAKNEVLSVIEVPPFRPSFSVFLLQAFDTWFVF